MSVISLQLLCFDFQYFSPGSSRTDLFHRWTYQWKVFRLCARRLPFRWEVILTSQLVIEQRIELLLRMCEVSLLIWSRYRYNESITWRNEKRKGEEKWKPIFSNRTLDSLDWIHTIGSTRCSVKSAQIWYPSTALSS